MCSQMVCVEKKNLKHCCYLPHITYLLIFTCFEQMFKCKGLRSFKVWLFEAHLLLVRSIIYLKLQVHRASFSLQKHFSNEKFHSFEKVKNNFEFLELTFLWFVSFKTDQCLCRFLVWKVILVYQNVFCFQDIFLCFYDLFC